ncbi:MAG: ornithine carbamoyltransferase [bacterium]|nr:ornithine carbamoyltransferase [bacterium]
MKKLKNKDLISVADLSRDEILSLFCLSEKLKKKGKKLLKGKTLAMIFEKSSTRTRVSFETGMYQLGGQAIFLSRDDMQLGRGETIRDTAMVLSRYLDGIMIRAYTHSSVLELAQYSTIPVINGLTDQSHPCQALSDFFTILEHKKNLKGLKLGYIGDGNNVANSLLLASSILGSDICIASPQNYSVNKEVETKARDLAQKENSRIILTQDPCEAAKDADVLYTDVWISMGQENEKEERLKIFRDYQINEKIMKLAKKDVMIMHCLPAHRGEEITAGAMDGPHSAIFDQAENRLHVQKSILCHLMG